MADQKFTIQELKTKVRQAVNDFVKERPSLLKLRAHEQAVSHRVAFYLENVFCESERVGLNVDCEYNKHLEKDKAINIDRKAFAKRKYKNCRCDGCKKLRSNKLPDEKLFRPDVVVHLRDTDVRNLIAIEIKKGKRCLFDEAKLQALTKLKDNGGQYEYQLEVFLYFPKRKPKYKWFAPRPKPPSTPAILCQTGEQTF